MKKLKYILGSIVVGFGLSGCLGQPSLPSVSEEEAFITPLTNNLKS